MPIREKMEMPIFQSVEQIENGNETLDQLRNRFDIFVARIRVSGVK